MSNEGYRDYTTDGVQTNGVVREGYPEWHKTDSQEEFRPWTGVTLA